MTARLAMAIGTAALVMAAFGPAAADEHELTPIPGSFLVTLEEGADRGPLKGLLRVFGAELRHEYALTPERVNVRGVPPGVEVALARVPGVRSVAPDYEVHAHLAESVPLIGADSVLAQTGGGAGIQADLKTFQAFGVKLPCCLECILIQKHHSVELRTVVVIGGDSGQA